MITAPVPHEQLLRVTTSYRHPIGARFELALFLDFVAASSGDDYYSGLADALRVDARITAAMPHWTN